MQPIFIPNAGIDSLQHALDHLAREGARSVQILGCVGNGWTSELLAPLLRSAPVPVFGGLFPGVIYDGQTHDLGAVLIGHAEAARVFDVELAVDNYDAEKWVSGIANARTVICYLDATCPTGALMRELFRNRTEQAVWCGGGAGSLDFVRQPVIITPRGLLEGAAVFACLDAPTTLGITHGWSAFGPPMLVTEARGNDVVTLDWRPAFEVYREAVEGHSSQKFDEEGFFTLASRYPLVLERFGKEGVVRDPLEALPSGELRCAGDIPTHSTVRVATGTFEQMLDAANEARVRAQGSRTEASGALALTIDCISRSLLLGERLREELEALRIPGTSQVGALTIGEVASDPDSFLQVHNKTTVLALIGPQDSAA